MTSHIVSSEHKLSKKRTFTLNATTYQDNLCALMQWEPMALARQTFSVVGHSAHGITFASFFCFFDAKDVGESHRSCCMLPAAIRFVLSDIFTTLTATERQKLLHVSFSALTGRLAISRTLEPSFLFRANKQLSEKLRTRVPALQEGAGHAVLSAYVEIVFDNSDNRLPVSPLLTVQS